MKEKMTYRVAKTEELRERILRILEEPCSIAQIVDRANVSISVVRKALKRNRGKGIRVCDWSRGQARPYAIYQVGTEPDVPEPPKYEKTYAQRKSVRMKRIAVDEPIELPPAQIIIQRDWLVAAFFGANTQLAYNPA